MGRVVVTATVNDGEAWERGFRTHADLFRSMTSTTVRYSVNGNRVAVYSASTDMDTWRSIFESQATADAMEFDGIQRDTVEVFHLDGDLPI